MSLLLIYYKIILPMFSYIPKYVCPYFHALLCFSTDILIYCQFFWRCFLIFPIFFLATFSYTLLFSWDHFTRSHFFFCPRLHILLIYFYRHFHILPIFFLLKFSYTIFSIDIYIFYFLYLCFYIPTFYIDVFI